MDINTPTEEVVEGVRSDVPPEDSLDFPREIKLTLQPPPPPKEPELTVRSAAHTLISQMRIIILMLMLFLILGVGAAFFYVNFTRTHTGVAGAVILFGFPEAEEGLNPLGNPLDVNMLRSPYVIGKALDELGLRERGISAESVRTNLRLREVVPFDAISRLQIIRQIADRVPARLEDLEEVIYHPTKFTLQLYRRGALESLEEPEMNELLNEIIRQYIVYFQDVYNDFVFFDVIMGQVDLDANDYFELVEILRGTINNMLSYTYGMREIAPDFRASGTQMTFGDIWANLELIRAINIQRVSALVHATGMSRNPSRMADILEYQILHLESELEVARANAGDALFLAYEIYHHQMWNLQHWEEHYHHLYHRSTEVYDFLLRSTFHYSRDANQLQADITFYRNRVEMLRGADVASPQDIRFVEEEIYQIFESLQTWESIINQTVEDYLTNELFRDAVRLLSPSSFANSMVAYRQQLVLIVMVAAAAGLFLGAMIALYRGERSIRRA